jgi:hypothetical protein
MNRPRRIAKFLILLVVGCAALGWLVMSLWNWLMPSLVSGVHASSYVQALGLFVLCRLLFGGFRGRGGWRPGAGRFGQRWEQLNDEERSKCRDALRAFRGGSRRRAENSNNPPPAV